MYISQILYLLLTVTNVYAFICSPLFSPKRPNFIEAKSFKVDMSNNYLENINNNPKPIKRLESLRNNITKYIQANKTENQPKLQKGITSSYMPIPKSSFDTIFLNINHIHKIYISYNVDRMIFEMKTGSRYVYYINSKDEYIKMNQLMNLIPNNYKAIIINDIHNTMDDPFGFLYCERK